MIEGNKLQSPDLRRWSRELPTASQVADTWGAVLTLAVHAAPQK